MTKRKKRPGIVPDCGPITSTEDALTKALYLAITAPDDKWSQVAARMADEFASTLPPSAIERCKKAALRMVSKP